ncbi:MAG: hypothetical protein ACKVVP_20495 [Chloroflexota bacterium]
MHRRFSFPKSDWSVRSIRWAVTSAVLTALFVLVTGTVSLEFAFAAEPSRGWSAQLGRGDATSFAILTPEGLPQAIGLNISADALASLPTEPSDYHHCYDRNGDGRVQNATECTHSHEFVIPLPDIVTHRTDVPFKWILLNWNAHGHIPPGVYDVPHFDVHFYMEPIANIFAIKDGPCGPEFVDCVDFETGKQPVPESLMHQDFKDVDAVVAAMGNHLIDVTGQEFQGEPFTRSWIYGAYGGRVIFYEEMVSLAYLRSQPDSCVPIKGTPSVAAAGYYPTQRCVRYDADARAYTVSMENFVYREALR